jgi:hypothetical protein
MWISYLFPMNRSATRLSCSDVPAGTGLPLLIRLSATICAHVASNSEFGLASFNSLVHAVKTFLALASSAQHFCAGRFRGLAAELGNSTITRVTSSLCITLLLGWNYCDELIEGFRHCGSRTVPIVHVPARANAELIVTLLRQDGAVPRRPVTS